MNQQNSLSLMLQQVIKAVPDYPKPGILFRDVTSLMQDPVAFAAVIDHLKQHYANHGFSKIVGTVVTWLYFWRTRWLMRWGWLLCRCANQANYHVSGLLKVTSWNMVRIRSKCILMLL